MRKDERFPEEGEETEPWLLLSADAWVGLSLGWLNAEPLNWEGQLPWNLWVAQPLGASPQDLGVRGLCPLGLPQTSMLPRVWGSHTG